MKYINKVNLHSYNYLVTVLLSMKDINKVNYCNYLVTVFLSMKDINKVNMHSYNCFVTVLLVFSNQYILSASVHFLFR
jgi:hypothetical protein